MLARARGLSGWPKILARNRWFQRKVVALTSFARRSCCEAADIGPPGASLRSLRSDSS